MKYIVKDLRSNSIVLETKDYARAEKALFKTPELGVENIVFENSDTGERTFALVCEKDSETIDVRNVAKIVQDAVTAALKAAQAPARAPKRAAAKKSKRSK